MAITDVQLEYIYSKMDEKDNLRIFGVRLQKPSDICKKMKTLNGEQIDAMIAEDKAKVIAEEQAKIAAAQAIIAAQG